MPSLITKNICSSSDEMNPVKTLRLNKTEFLVAGRCPAPRTPEFGFI